MSLYFPTRFRRQMVAGFAGDAVPAGAQVANNPATFVGNMLRLPVRRLDDPAGHVERLQGYWRAGGGYVGTLSFQLFVCAASGLAANDWIAVGTPLLLVSPLVLFESVGKPLNADVVLQVTPSVALAGAETADLFLAESL